MLQHLHRQARWCYWREVLVRAGARGAGEGLQHLHCQANLRHWRGGGGQAHICREGYPLKGCAGQGKWAGEHGIVWVQVEMQGR